MHTNWKEELREHNRCLEGFIESLLTTQKEEIRKVVKKMESNVDKRGSSCYINGVIDDESTGGGYLWAISDILAELNK